MGSSYAISLRIIIFPLKCILSIKKIINKCEYIKRETIQIFLFFQINILSVIRYRICFVVHDAELKTPIVDGGVCPPKHVHVLVDFQYVWLDVFHIAQSCQVVVVFLLELRNVHLRLYIKLCEMDGKKIHLQRIKHMHVSFGAIERERFSVFRVCYPEHFLSARELLFAT